MDNASIFGLATRERRAGCTGRWGRRRAHGMEVGRVGWASKYELTRMWDMLASDSSAGRIHGWRPGIGPLKNQGRSWFGWRTRAECARCLSSSWVKNAGRDFIRSSVYSFYILKIIRISRLIIRQMFSFFVLFIFLFFCWLWTVWIIFYLFIFVYLICLCISFCDKAELKINLTQCHILHIYMCVYL